MGGLSAGFEGWWCGYLAISTLWISLYEIQGRCSRELHFRNSEFLFPLHIDHVISITSTSE